MTRVCRRCIKRVIAVMLVLSLVLPLLLQPGVVQAQVVEARVRYGTSEDSIKEYRQRGETKQENTEWKQIEGSIHKYNKEQEREKEETKVRTQEVTKETRVAKLRIVSIEGTAENREVGNKEIEEIEGSDAKRVKGVTYKITDKTGTEMRLIKETPEAHIWGRELGIVTDPKGEVVVTIPYGEYNIKEVRPADGYGDNEKPIKLKIDKEKEYTLVMGSKKPDKPIETRSLSVTKEWVGEKPRDAVVVLEADKEIKEVINLDESNNWTHTFEGLPKTRDKTREKEIDYTLRKVGIAGYTTEIRGSMLQGYKVVSTRVEGSLEIVNVVGGDEARLQGTEYELRKPDKTVYKSVSLGEDGSIKIDKIPSGRYTLVETKAPEGYEKETKEYEVIIGDTEREKKIKIRKEPVKEGKPIESRVAKEGKPGEVKEVNGSIPATRIEVVSNPIGYELDVKGGIPEGRTQTNHKEDNPVGRDKEETRVAPKEGFKEKSIIEPKEPITAKEEKPIEPPKEGPVEPIPKQRVRMLRVGKR